MLTVTRTVGPYGPAIRPAPLRFPPWVFVASSCAILSIIDLVRIKSRVWVMTWHCRWFTFFWRCRACNRRGVYQFFSRSAVFIADQQWEAETQHGSKCDGFPVGRVVLGRESELSEGKKEVRHVVGPDSCFDGSADGSSDGSSSGLPGGAGDV